MLALVAALAGCVTEQTAPVRGVRVRPGERAPTGPGRAGPGATADLPARPVATPVTDRTRTARVRVEVLPLGTVSYDGQVLPLVSPDGRFLAVQDGQTPTWETLLARPGASVPVRTTIAVVDISGPDPSPVTFPEPLPPGLVLGRATDDRGFLVEWPRPDGARWIGRVEWVTGRLSWLAADARVNAHAALTPAGDAVFTRRDAAADRAELVLRRADGTEDTRRGEAESYLFPMCTQDVGVVYTLVESAAGLELLALSSPLAEPGRRTLGAPIARTLLARVAAPELAYQVAAPVAPALPARPSEVSAPGTHPTLDQLVAFVPAAGRMGRFDLSTGLFEFLPARSVAAGYSRWVSPPGYFAATPEGLMFVPEEALRRAEPGREPAAAPVLADPYVPRATTDPQRPFVLIGPVPRDPTRLRIVAMAVPQDPPAKEGSRGN